MAQSTTAYNACDVSVWVDDDTGTLTDVSGSSNSIGANFVNELGTWRSFQEKWSARLECAKDGTITLNVVSSTAAGEAWAIFTEWYFVSGGSRTFSWYEPDKNVGSHYFTGEYKVESMDSTADNTDANAKIVTVILKPDGAISHSTVAT
jgi:hypothetical protein